MELLLNTLHSARSLSRVALRFAAIEWEVSDHRARCSYCSATFSSLRASFCFCTPYPSVQNPFCSGSIDSLLLNPSDFDSRSEITSHSPLLLFIWIFALWEKHNLTSSGCEFCVISLFFLFLFCIVRIERFVYLLRILVPFDNVCF